VLIVDLDGGVPDAAGHVTASDGDTAVGVADWTRVGRAVRPDSLTRLITPIAPGIDLLPRGSGPIETGRLPLLIQLLHEQRRPILIDLGRLPDAGRHRRVTPHAEQSVLVIRNCAIAIARAVRERE